MELVAIAILLLILVIGLFVFLLLKQQAGAEAENRESYAKILSELKSLSDRVDKLSAPGGEREPE